MKKLIMRNRIDIFTNSIISIIFTVALCIMFLCGLMLLGGCQAQEKTELSKYPEVSEPETLPSQNTTEGLVGREDEYVYDDWRTQTSYCGVDINTYPRGVDSIKGGIPNIKNDELRILYVTAPDGKNYSYYVSWDARVLVEDYQEMSGPFLTRELRMNPNKVYTIDLVANQGVLVAATMKSR